MIDTWVYDINITGIIMTDVSVWKINVEGKMLEYIPHIYDFLIKSIIIVLCLAVLKRNKMSQICRNVLETRS